MLGYGNVAHLSATGPGETGDRREERCVPRIDTAVETPDSRIAEAGTHARVLRTPSPDARAAALAAFSRAARRSAQLGRLAAQNGSESDPVQQSDTESEQQAVDQPREVTPQIR